MRTPIYALAKFLVPILKSSTSNEHLVKGSFAFVHEIVEHEFEFFLGRLDVDSLFTNTTLEETTDICIDTLF